MTRLSTLRHAGSSVFRGSNGGVMRPMQQALFATAARSVSSKNLQQRSFVSQCTKKSFGLAGGEAELRASESPCHASSKPNHVVKRGFATTNSAKASFPSLTITRESVTAQGSFAEQQAEYLNPSEDTARALAKTLKEKEIGVVAHFYMDAELQGTLVKVAEDWEHVFCADSLAMGFAAVEMAEKGCKAIACLGVDFMAESVKACLDQSGFQHVPVFRLKEEHIGCSLAASAEQAAYEAYLRQGSKLKNPLHVIYINTALQTKAKTHNIVPTITCTSSNVVKTILQATAEMPECNILYGPDTYMGENIKQLFETLIGLPDDSAIQKLHPLHTRATLQKVLDQYTYFKQGICVVHHMFGGKVTQKVKDQYPLDANTFYTAHFEVPGEMFTIASEAAADGKGVVGSTSNILNFITDKAATATGDMPPQRFILGTEAGMVTGIVKNVQDTLKEAKSDAKIEIVFPVAEEAVSATGNAEIPLVPGVKAGEGCSSAGGCATCPFMKMNDLGALQDIVDDLPNVNAPGNEKKSFDELLSKSLEGFIARVPADGRTADGYDLLDGTKPIAYMRSMMQNGRMAEDLMGRVAGMNGVPMAVVEPHLGGAGSIARQRAASM